MKPLLTCSLIGAALLAAGAPAQGERPVAFPAIAEDVETAVRDGLMTFPERVLVKLREGSGAELVGGELRSRTGWDLSPVARHFAAPGVSAERAIATATFDELTGWQQRAIANLGPDRDHPGHLGLWFRLVADDGDLGDALVAELRREALVEHVYQEPVPYLQSTEGMAAVAPAAVQNPPDTPDFTAFQTYMDPAPVGTGSRLVQSVVGGRGRSVVVGQCEGDWIIGHEDVESIVPSAFFGGQPLGTTRGRHHGTAGAGLITCDRNTWGLTGLADLATMQFFIWPSFGVGGSLFEAANQSQPGDVIMIILSYLLRQTGPGDFVPIEYSQLDYNAILTVTGNGYHLLENAGNGASNLDDPRYTRRFDLTFRDSGAIMVGASDADVPIGRAYFSNYGSRLDCSGQGLACHATGYGTLFSVPGTSTRHYTELYQGTSSATGMIAGVVAQIAGAARFQLGRDLTPAELRQALRQHGTPTAGNIGPRPDLPRIFEALGLFDGLRSSRPEARAGEAFDLTLEGPPGSACLLFLGFDVVEQDFGFNRKLHIGPAGLATHGAYVLTGGATTVTMSVPAQLAVHGIDVLFQALRADGGTLHVTNSVQVHLL